MQYRTHSFRVGDDLLPKKNRFQKRPKISDCDVCEAFSIVDEVEHREPVDSLQLAKWNVDFAIIVNPLIICVPC